MKWSALIIVKVCLLSGCLLAPVAQAKAASKADEAVEVIRHYQKAFRFEYHLELLELVLSETEDEFGPYRLQPVPEDVPEVSEARGVRMLDRGDIDLVFLSTSIDREEQFHPVRIPLLKGLLGFRLLLINESHQPQYSEVLSLTELRDEFWMGFNPHWVDYDIYKANDFNIISSVQYDELFSMLNAGRFDFIPRGVNEIWRELAYFTPSHPNLSIEQELVLYYPYPVYFFVDPDNDRLHERLTRGLEKLQEDGRFHELLKAHFEDDVTLARLNERRLFELDNPTLPDKDLAEDMKWWLEQAR